MVVMANAQGVNTGQLAMRAYEIVAPTIRTAVKATSTKGLRRKTLVAVPIRHLRDRVRWRSRILSVGGRSRQHRAANDGSDVGADEVEENRGAHVP